MCSGPVWQQRAGDKALMCSRRITHLARGMIDHRAAPCTTVNARAVTQNSEGAMTGSSFRSGNVAGMGIGLGRGRPIEDDDEQQEGGMRGEEYHISGGMKGRRTR